MKLYKYRSFENFEYLLDILIHERLYCSEYKSLNDPFEGTFFAILPQPIYFSAGTGTSGQPLVRNREIKSVDDLFISSTKKRVCSLSSSCSDVRLWSIYASGHAGIAIEIDFSDHLNDVHKVDYVNNFPEVRNTILNEPTEVKILTHKTVHWDYESEYRIIIDSEYYSIEGRIKRILLGQRVSDDRIKIIERITDNKIPLVKTKLDYDSIHIVS